MTSVRLCFTFLLVSAVTSADNFCRTQSDFKPTAIATGTTTCSALSTLLLGKVSGSPSTWSAVTCNQVFDTSWQDAKAHNSCTSNAKATDCTTATPVCSVTSASKHGLSVAIGACSTKPICDAMVKAAKAPTKVTCSSGTASSPTKACMVGTLCNAPEIKNVGEHLWTFGTQCCGSAYKTLLGKTCYGCIDIAKGATANSMGWFTASGSTKTSIVKPGDVAPASGKFCSLKPPSTAKQGTCKVASWTNKKHGDTTAAAPYSTCDTCTVLISTTKYKTCKAYCAAQTGSLTCAGAWDEVLDSCIKKKVNGASPLTCDSTISSSDMICKCCPASGCPVTTSGSSRSSSAGLVVGIVVGIAAAIVGA